MIKSLHVLNHPLAESSNQLTALKSPCRTSFSEMLRLSGQFPLTAGGIEIFQVNLGKMCNQTCRHCHVDAGPDRKEIMSRQTMETALEKLAKAPHSVTTVDITGGAPEMNPDFRWFVEAITALGKKIIVRCNLTIIVANRKFHDLPEFFRKHNVEVVSSLPSYTADRTDRQRGEGVFNDSISALKMLNRAGYGQPGSGLILNLVYNPAGAFMPPPQAALENEYHTELFQEHGVRFNNLFTITNMPISRYLDYLLTTGNLERYMEKLIGAFNPAAVQHVMCRNTLSIGWDGTVYDCDFNQMLDLPVINQGGAHLKDLNWDTLSNREIVTNEHCYGCTAGSGSSCGGSLTN